MGVMIKQVLNYQMIIFLLTSAINCLLLAVNRMALVRAAEWFFVQIKPFCFKNLVHELCWYVSVQMCSDTRQRDSHAVSLPYDEYYVTIINV